MTLDVIVDASSVEVFVNGESVLSSVVFGQPGANGLSVESVGGHRVSGLRLAVGRSCTAPGG